MQYLYESHLGGLYTSDIELDDDTLYCEQCGDSDWLIGSFETIQDFWSLIKDECDIEGSGGLSLQYIYHFMAETFNLPDVVECQDDSVFCLYSDEEIIARIEELIKESQHE